MGKPTNPRSSATMLAGRLAFVLGCACVAGYLSWYLKVVRSRDAVEEALQVAGSTEPDDMVPAVAAQAEQLRGNYQKMADDFADLGLDEKAIASLKPYFHGFQPGEISTWPKRYDQFDPPLPADSVRLLVIPLEDSPMIASAAARAAGKVAALLPKGTKLFSNARNQYHVTVFHSSHPADPRPDPFSQGGGLEATPGAQPHNRSQVAQDILERETETVTKLVSKVYPPVLEVVSLVMTRSGTLLLTWIDRTGRVAEMRDTLKAAFPGATSRQATIIHTTLLRVVSPEPLPAETTESIAELTAELTKQLQGKLLTPGTLWWVSETEFSTVVGHRQVVHFMAPTDLIPEAY